MKILYQHILILKPIECVSSDLFLWRNEICAAPENELVAKTVVRDELENDTLAGSVMQ